MARAENTHFEIDGHKVPVKIYRELRRNARASVGKDAILIRLPRGVGAKVEKQQIDHFRDWVCKQFRTNSKLKERFIKRDFQDGDRIHVGSRWYRLRVLETDYQTHSGLLNGEVIELRLSRKAPKEQRDKSVRQLLSRIVAQDFLPAISRRVRELNKLHFQEVKRVKQVRLKYLHSRWGSCSSDSNINLSTRLLFAPESVIDYVIIHELAHLQELNHSPRFWRLVSEAMPDYQLKEKWLKDNGHLCDF